jgi:hypothetical protein
MGTQFNYRCYAYKTERDGKGKCMYMIHSVKVQSAEHLASGYSIVHIVKVQSAEHVASGYSIVHIIPYI